jgi:repressor LexA
MAKELTVKQQEIIDFLQYHQREFGVMPTTREIQLHFGYASQTAAISHLRCLEKKGAIQRMANKARAVILPQVMGSERFSLNLPLFGEIPAGFAQESIAQYDETLPIDSRNFRISNPQQCFALRVTGQSMINASIEDGDIVILENKPARHLDIVAALIDGESTLKRYMVESGKIYLKPENSRFKNMYPEFSLQVQGVMVGLLRAF